MLSFKSYSTIKKTDRVIMSPDKEIIFRPIKQTIAIKPTGLWYASGTGWLDWVDANAPTWKVEHLHRLEVYDNPLIQLSTAKEVADFDRKYGSGHGMIDWKEVAKTYAGIEVAPYISSLRFKYMWYYAWDVASGCIWSKRAIKKITLIE